MEYEKVWMTREEVKKWLLETLTNMNRPLKMKEICNLRRKENKQVSWHIIFTAVDDLIKEEKAKSMIFAGSEYWGLVKI